MLTTDARQGSEGNIGRGKTRPSVFGLTRTREQLAVAEGCQLAVSENFPAFREAIKLLKWCLDELVTKKEIL